MPGDAFLIGGCRTPLGKLGGRLASIQDHDLAAAVLRGALDRTGVASTAPDRVILANTLGRGNVARRASLSAGLDVTVPAATINTQCTGGLAALTFAADAVRAGSARVVLGGGVDSASNATVSLAAPVARSSNDQPRVEHAPSPFRDPDMGPAADAIAAHFHVSRSDQDDVALESYRRALAAREEGFFDAVIEPVVVDGEQLRRDELPRRMPREDRLRRYPPAHAPGGSVTAGNAAPIADGAAALVVAADPGSANPPVRVVATASAAGDTAYPAAAVIPAIEAVLVRAGVAPGDIACWEVNEAFAVKIVLAHRHFAVPPGRLNVHGGAIAFGHPFAASGAVLALHLIESLRRSGGRYGLAAIAGAGGLGEAMLVECRS